MKMCWFQIREFTGEDDSDLFLDERETALKVAQDEKRKHQASVPGILNPHEAEEMQEMWTKVGVNMLTKTLSETRAYFGGSQIVPRRHNG